MSNESKTLRLMASKLGLINEDLVVNKAAELERRLVSKSTGGANITETCKAVICLDLAAALFGANFDVKTAIKYTGLKPSMYTSSKKYLENILDLDDDKLTISVLCASLHCSGVEELADNILLEYQKKAKMDIDTSLPQYVCMAVYQACRANKVKVPKTKMVEKSRLKPGQWTKLDAEWTKFVDEHFAAAKKKGRRPKNVNEDLIEEKMQIDSVKKESEETQIELYEDWKRRILAAAYKQMELEKKSKKELEKDTQKQSKKTEVDKNTRKEMELESDSIRKQRDIMTPRRSPRKTPQKFEPYKSPSKCKAVRLLFPLNL